MRSFWMAAGILVAGASPAHAWSFDAHRFIVDRAIALLPVPLRPFYERHRAFIVEHSIDPDLWRDAGFAEEPPRHYLNLDAFGSPPFPELPRDYDRAVEKYGVERFERNGMLPWRTAEIFGRLRRAFEDAAKDSGRAPAQIRFFSAVLGHYAADAHVPFHAVLNHDGQMTGQHGIHARFESDLFARYRSSIDVRPAPSRSIQDPRAFIFEVLLASFDLAPPILDADSRARASSPGYDDAYYGRFFERVRPVLERRLADAVTAVASLIQGAWEAAGRPAITPAR